MNRRALLSALSFLIATTACGDEAKPGGRGVVGATAPDGGPTTVVAELELSMGDLDAPEAFAFADVYSGFLTESEIVVADGGSLTVRVFDWAGIPLRRIGSRGAGPGEFTNIRWVSKRADSLVVLDGRTGRVSVFDSEGDFARALRLPLEAHGQATWVESLNGDFLVALETGLDPRLLSGAGRDSVVVLQVADVPSEGTVRVVKEIVTLANRWWRPKPKFYAFGIQAVFDGPVALVAVGGGALWTAENDAPLLRSHKFGRRSEPVALTLASEPAAMISASDGIRARLFEQLIVDDRGLVWLSHFETSAGRRNWNAFDDTGRVVREMVLPADLRVLDIRGDRLLARRLDELGVERVQLWSMK